MVFTRSLKGHVTYTSTRKKPEIVYQDMVDGTDSFYIDAMSEAVYLIIQLPNGTSDPVTVNYYQALSNDGLNDDTEPSCTFTIDPSSNRIQYSDIVLTFAPYLKVEIIANTEVTVYMDYI